MDRHNCSTISQYHSFSFGLLNQSSALGQTSAFPSHSVSPSFPAPFSNRPSLSH